MKNQGKEGNFETFLRNKRNLCLVFSNAVLFLVGIIFTLILIVSATRPVTLGKEYKYEFGELGDTYYTSVNMTFTEKYCTMELFDGTETMEAIHRYKIKDSKLYMKFDNEEWRFCGIVSSYKLEGLVSGEMMTSITLECASAKTLKVVSIVFLCVGFAGGAVLTAINCLNYKKSGTIVLETENNQ